jgi:hypothetical protein
MYTKHCSHWSQIEISPDVEGYSGYGLLIRCDDVGTKTVERSGIECLILQLSTGNYNAFIVLKLSKSSNTCSGSF